MPHIAKPMQLEPMTAVQAKSGLVTIPTDLDIIPETMDVMKRWGADAIRDCDGTSLPDEILDSGAKIYSTYYTTRKENAWAKANPDEVQQMYVSTNFITATDNSLRIHLMDGIHPELLEVNERDDYKRWWEVMDRSTGQPLDNDEWEYERQSGEVLIKQAEPFHTYSVSFLAYIIWDPVHMYNAVTNDWQDFEHQMTFDVRQPKTKAWSLQRLRDYLEANPQIDVIRFTTFFHQFTLIFDELARQKYVDWYGYSASVSPYILEQFEEEVGYRFRPEYIIDEGYYVGSSRVPSPQFLDFQRFQMREVAKLAKEFVDICHEYKREAMMFLGDHWIGTEPFGPYFAEIGLDALVGSVGNAATLRLITDVEGVNYREGRFLPYFFPDTFYPGGNPLAEAQYNWVTARRALLRKPLDRIGYGGYLKLALDFPDFIDYIAKVTEEFRLLKAQTDAGKPYTFKRIAVLSTQAELRRWGLHMVHHALYYKQNYSYAGVIDALAGAPYDVTFLDFDHVAADPACLDGIDLLINIADQDTAHSGATIWEKPELAAALKRFVWQGGGFIGVGEPTAHAFQGRIFQLADVLGVENEKGYSIGRDKYNRETQSHFITEGIETERIDFGEEKPYVYALEGSEILAQTRGAVQLAANQYGRGRAVYISGLPFNFENARLLHRAILWSCHAEEELLHWYSENPYVDVHAYPENHSYCIVNNTNEEQHTKIYDGNGQAEAFVLSAGEILWKSYTE